MIFDHDCSCCEILCSDATEKHNKAIDSQIEKIQSLEQEVARLKDENLKLKNCHNCKFPIFDYGEMDCPKKDKSFYDKYELRHCDKWEIKK